MNYAEVQTAAKKTMEYAIRHIRSGMKLTEVRELCERKMLELGIDSFWYWDVGAFCFAGEDTTVSVSGRRYSTSSRTIEKHDLITIDLSPQCGEIWGDYARTLIIEDGVVKTEPDSVENEEWKNGLQMGARLHREMRQFVTPETTFEELYNYMNDYIVESGYVNLDFLGNLGHSIVKKKEDRIYIEKGNLQKLSSVDYFTFEPHISVPGSAYGYKMENIYYFQDGQLMEL